MAPQPSTQHLTFISMATGILIHHGLVFIQKRKNNDIWGGLWEFPGGVLEKGETPKQAVAREFWEETGLKIQPTLALGHFQHKHNHYRVTMHAFFVKLRTPSPSIALTAAQEYRWATWTEVKALDFTAGHLDLVHYLDKSLEFQARIYS